MRGIRLIEGKRGHIYFSDAATKIHMGGQGKHIPGHNNYDPSRDALTADPQDFLAGVHSGRYPVIRSIPHGNNECTLGPFRTEGQAFEWYVQLLKTDKSQIVWATRDGSHANVSLVRKITHK